MDDPRVLATLFGTAVSALVAVLIWLGNKRWERRQQAKVHNKKVEDMMRALVAEIRAFQGSHVLQLKDIDSFIESAPKKFSRPHGSSQFVPFIPSEKHDRLFEAVVQDIQILPSSTIGPVVSYYNQVLTIRLVAEDMQGESYAKLPGDRRQAILITYLQLIKFAYTLARDAIFAPEGEISKFETGQ